MALYICSSGFNLKAQGTGTLNDPGSLTEYRGKNGQTFKFQVTGTDAGSIWGGANGIYTDDSQLGKAAVHAGILKIGESGVVNITIIPGQPAYTGNIQNSISSQSYGNWTGSFRFVKSASENNVLGYQVSADPGSLTEYRNKNGQTFKFRVTGTDTGSIWGGANGIYTDDSQLGKAAVHAGILKIGESGVVNITIIPGQPAYTGNTQNSISSQSYGNWTGSFRFVKSASENKVQGVQVSADPGSLTEYRNKNGQIFKFRVTGTDAGSIWGGANGIYTDDSRLGKAATHAGKLKIGEEGVVTITIIPGQPEYTGNTQNGISSASYGNWTGSFRFE